MPKPRYETYVLKFPVKGLMETNAFDEQAMHTTPRLLNVRAFDLETDRARGGKRPGLSKHSTARVNGTEDIQDLIHVVTAAAYSGTQTIGTRTVTLVAMAGGVARKITSTASVVPGTGSLALSANVPVIFSAELFGVIYYSDGANYGYYNVVTNTQGTWAASPGTLPAATTNTCRLLETWNGRIVMSGLVGDEHNFFMSRQGDADDWDYLPNPPDEQQAVAGNASLVGKIGDIINGMIPYSDDILLFLCDHSIWMLSGDPMSGGRIDRVSDVTGGAWGRAWCKDPYGRVYFIGSRGGVYRMTPGQQIERISSLAIDARTRKVSLLTHMYRLAWSDDEQGVYVFVVPLTDEATADNFFYDARTEGWFVDRYGFYNHHARAVYVYDGDAPTDRAILLGCKDGFVRKIDRAAYSDDGTAITSYVFIGPIRPKDKMSQCVFDQITATLGSKEYGIGTVLIRLWAGETEEAALGMDSFVLGVEDGDVIITEDQYNLLLQAGNGPRFSESFGVGTNVTHHPHVRGFVGYVEIYDDSDDVRWSLERIELRLRPLPSAARGISV